MPRQLVADNLAVVGVVFDKQNADLVRLCAPRPRGELRGIVGHSSIIISANFPHMVLGSCELRPHCDATRRRVNLVAGGPPSVMAHSTEGRSNPAAVVWELGRQAGSWICHSIRLPQPGQRKRWLAVASATFQGARSIGK